MDAKLLFCMGLGGFLGLVGCRGAGGLSGAEDAGVGAAVAEMGLGTGALTAYAQELAGEADDGGRVRYRVSAEDAAILLKIQGIEQATSVVQEDGRLFLVSDPKTFALEDWGEQEVDR